MFALDEQTKISWGEDVLQETLDVWGTAISFFNNVNRIVTYFPEDIDQKISDDIHINALNISNMIARGYRSNQTQEFKKSIDEAISTLHLTIANLYLAKDGGYLNKHKFYEIYHSGAILEKRLKLFKNVIYTPFELN